MRTNRFEPPFTYPGVRPQPRPKNPLWPWVVCAAGIIAVCILRACH